MSHVTHTMGELRCIQSGACTLQRGCHNGSFVRGMNHSHMTVLIWFVHSATGIFMCACVCACMSQRLTFLGNGVFCFLFLFPYSLFWHVTGVYALKMLSKALVLRTKQVCSYKCVLFTSSVWYQNMFYTEQRAIFASLHFFWGKHM